MVSIDMCLIRAHEKVMHLLKGLKNDKSLLLDCKAILGLAFEFGTRKRKRRMPLILWGFRQIFLFALCDYGSPVLIRGICEDTQR